MLQLFGDAAIQSREASLYFHHVASPSRMQRRRQPGRADRVQVSAARQPEMVGAPHAAGALATGDILPGLPGNLIAVVEDAPGARTMRASASDPPASGRPVPVGEGPQPQSPGPVALTATIRQGDPVADRGLLLPFESGVGAAAFSRGDEILIVFDAPRPLDLSAVQDDPLGARSSIELLPEATIVRLPGHRADAIGLRRVPSGWLVQRALSVDSARSILPAPDGAGLRLPVDSPGRTVIVPDPASGGNLLVGTLRDGRDASRSTRHASTATIEQTILGIVVDPLCDRLELRPTRDAFLLSGIPAEAIGRQAAALPMGLQGSEDAPVRILSLEPGAPASLMRRFRDAKAQAAAAPAEGRFLLRLRAAEAALALGDGTDAATIIRVAMADDAQHAAALRPRLIASAAALLDHQADASDLLDDAGLSELGEPALWRAVKLAGHDPASSEAARLFAANLALAQSYPAPLRTLLLPLAAESLVRAGNDMQARLIERLAEEPSLAFARALLERRHGRAKAALAVLDRLASSPDWRLSEKAAEEAVSIRERQPGADSRKLADEMEARLLDARIVGRECESRFHLADLRIRARQWQKALGLLRETARLCPEQEADARRRVGEALEGISGVQAASGQGEALDQAAMIESNADMLLAGAEGTQVSLFLAARLASLDLPERAAPIVQKMMQAAEPGAGRAELGFELATLAFQQNDLVGAQAALRDSDQGGLPAGLATSRSLILARALAGEGQLDQALATVAPLHTDAALDLEASLHGRLGDWAGATDSLMMLAQQRLPAAGRLDVAGQDLLLRLASAASRTKDKARIEQVRTLGSSRFADTGKVALFRLLTSDPDTDEVNPARDSAEVAALRHASGILDAVAQ